MRRKVIGIIHLGLSLLGERMERLLGQKDAEIERLRGQLEDERRDLDEARAELARLREQTTPRIYKEGDPKPETLWWWVPQGEAWVRLDPDLLESGDLWLPPPPPPDEALLDQRATKEPDTIQRVTQESDEASAELARRDRSDAQDVVDVAAETLKTYIQDGEDIGDAIVRLWNERADLVEACRVHERERASLHARFVQSVQDNGTVADALLSSQRERDEARAERDAARAARYTAEMSLCNVADDLTRLRNTVRGALDVLFRSGGAADLWGLIKDIQEARDMLGAAMPKSLNVK